MTASPHNTYPNDDEQEVSQTEQLPPLERAKGLFDTLDTIPKGYEHTREHRCPDGSLIHGVALRSGQYNFYVFAPVKTPSDRHKRIEIELGPQGIGTLKIPEVNVILGEEIVAVASQARPQPVSEAAQHTLIDWVNRIVESDQYSPLGLVI